jgi:hypothetical protein
MSEFHNDLDALISSTLDALDGSPAPTEQPETVPSSSVAQNDSSTETEGDLDSVLSRIKEAAPQIKQVPQTEADTDSAIAKLFEDLLTPDSIVDSMEALAIELELYLKQQHGNSDDIQRYQKQLSIYKDVSSAYKLNEKILDEQTPEGERIRTRIAELQSLGSPPQEVVEKLMLNQLPAGDAAGDIAKEFETFLKEAGSGGVLPGLTKEDEEMLKKLSEDPNALKNLLGGADSGKPGDCSVM